MINNNFDNGVALVKIFSRGLSYDLDDFSLNSTYFGKSFPFPLLVDQLFVHSFKSSSHLNFRPTPNIQSKKIVCLIKDSDGEIKNSGKSMGKSGYRISVTFKL